MILEKLENVLLFPRPSYSSQDSPWMVSEESFFVFKEEKILDLRINGHVVDRAVIISQRQ